jgi:predicted permease
VPEIRDAVRALLRWPGPSLTAVLVLAIGTGATTAIFSVINGVLLRPMPFADPHRLVQFEPMGVLDFQAYRDESRSFEAMISYQAVNKSLQGVTEPERVAALATERGLFDLLGVPPLVGRTFAPADPPDVAIVTEGFWRSYGGAALVDGWKIQLDGASYTVIGVMPQGFQFPYRQTTVEIWIPSVLPRTASRFQHIDAAIGRVKREVTIDQARAELRAIGRRSSAGSPPSDETDRLAIVPLTDAVVGGSRRVLLMLFGAVAMVMLMACANVANLLLVRAETRRRDLALRTALGASRGRLVRQFLTESLALALAAGAGAIAIAQGGTTLLVAFAGARIPRASEIGIDWTVLLFLVALSLICGVALGAVPALSATRGDLARALAEPGGRASGGRRSSRIMKGLVVVEIAVAFILLIGAGLLLRAFLFLENTPTGVVADRVLTLRMETRGLLPPQAARAQPAGSETDAQTEYFRAIEQRVRQIPGVRTVGFVNLLPVQSPGNAGSFAIAGRPLPPEGSRPSARLRYVSAGYFRALGIPLRAGALFTDREPGVVVNEALVQRYFPNEDPIGRVLDRGRIIGVAGDVRQRMTVPAEPEIYAPLAGSGYSAATLVVSAEIPVAGLAGPIRSAIHELNPNQAVYNITTMDDVVNASHPELDLYLRSVACFAGLALLLSMAGIFGVVSHATAARQREFGIRIAVGADGGRLLRLVLAQSGMLIVTGLALGIAGALALTRLLRSQLYGVTPTDPATFALAAVVLACVALAACLNPAWRAMKVDPMSVLRYE